MIHEPLGDSLLARALSRVYGTGVALRNWRYDHIPGSSAATGKPTISIGGIHAGGTGKTPMAHLIGAWLVEAGYTVAYLSRGYGRTSRGRQIVGPGQAPRWDQVGDEPAMLHELLPETWLGVGAKRRASARALLTRLDRNAVFVLDDGFQHRAVRRDLDIVCLPATPHAGRLIPAGVMREPIESLARAQILCVVGAEEDVDILADEARRLRSRFPSSRVYPLYQRTLGWVNTRTGQAATVPRGAQSALVCGIARPERFVAMVRRMGIEPKEHLVRPDHHVFAHEEIRGIAGRGHTHILTTHKDACRLCAINLVDGPDICYLRVTPAFLEERQERELRESVLCTAARNSG